MLRERKSEKERQGDTGRERKLRKRETGRGRKREKKGE